MASQVQAISTSAQNWVKQTAPAAANHVAALAKGIFQALANTFSTLAKELTALSNKVFIAIDGSLSKLSPKSRAALLVVATIAAVAGLVHAVRKNLAAKTTEPETTEKQTPVDSLTVVVENNKA